MTSPLFVSNKIALFWKWPFHCTTFVTQGKRTSKLISLKNIHSVLERNEMEAWQKLIRVLTHEIMNSITPIISLSETLSERGIPESAWRKRIFYYVASHADYSQKKQRIIGICGKLSSARHESLTPVRTQSFYCGIVYGFKEIISGRVYSF